ncbi:LIM and calponin homology domains-containing protein 1-like isoform X3 [Mytilus edulis]
MPVGSDMRRYGSTNSLNRSGELRLSSNLEANSYDGYHQSTPDLSNPHTRTSSVDSYDDSHGNHSRQSSDSVDIPTRTTKTQRKVSQSEDPLKFIKLKPSKDLAKQAVEQITMVKEEKQVRKTIERDEEDWQSNLSSWKNRRRRVSAATIERVEGADDINKSEEDKKKPAKTFDQMKKEREKRKSVGQLPVHFYPIEDNEDLLWDVKTPSKAPGISDAMSRIEGNQTESEPKRAPMLSAKSRSKSMGNAFTGSGVSAWADRDKEQKDTSYKSKTENRSSRTLDENHNAEKPPNQSARRLSNKFNSMLKSFESKEDNETSKVYEKPPRKSFEFSSIDAKSDKFKDPKILDTQTARSTLSPKKKPEPTRPKNYIEKDIKIKQKSHNPKGFGITVIGGQDKKQPVIIDKVNLDSGVSIFVDGSAADVCEVQAKDEIISVNNRDIGIMTQAMVRKVIDDANKKGELEIRVRRYNAEESEEEEDEDDDEDDDAFHPSINSSVEPDTSFSTKSTFQPSRTSSRVSESPSTPETTQRTRSSYQTSSLSRRTESPSSQESPLRSHDPSPASRTTESSSTDETPRFARSTHEFSARTRPSPEKTIESAPPKEEVITTTVTKVTESSPKPTEMDTSLPPYQRRRQRPNYNFNTQEDTEPKTSILTELGREKEWIMEQMSGTKSSTNEEKVTEREEAAIEDQIIPQSKPNEESSYHRSYKSYNKTEEPVTKEEPVLQQTSPSYEKIEEEKPTIRVHRSRPPEEDTSRRVREIPVTRATKPEVNHIDLPVHTNHREDRHEDLSPSQSSGGFGPPEILRRWQRPRPRSEYSSSSSINNDDKRLSAASLDSTASSPRFPEDDIAQNHMNGAKPHAVVGQPVILEFTQEPSSQSFNMSAPSQSNNASSSSLVIDPRNRMDESDVSLPQYNFHFNIGDNNSKEKDQLQYDLEAERERIRHEEKERMEYERRQWEEEEQRRIQEKEAQLREEEEKLQREKQRIEEMKASMEREKMELSKHQNDNRNSDQYNTYSDNKHGSDRYSRSRPDNHNFSAYANSNSTPRTLDTSSSWRSSHPKEEPQQRENLSREDMLAMNRTAKPFSRRPENEQQNNANDNHVQRDNLSKEDIHGLNYAPRPKIRSSQDWIQNNDSGSKHSSRSESPNEHWLIEEAERRRKSGHTSGYQTGPIQPKSDILSNRWQNDRHGQPSGSMSPQNTRSYEVKQFSAKSQNKLNQTLPANFSIGNIKPKPMPPVPPKPGRNSNSNFSSSTRAPSNVSSPTSPSSPKSYAEQVVAVSGKQLCSHCSQELGFGAAMVIESLGLYYHVQCFKCCVCHSALGNGVQGADVRVRVNKLHCRNCYSNEEAGLKFSKV